MVGASVGAVVLVAACIDARPHRLFHTFSAAVKQAADGTIVNSPAHTSNKNLAIAVRQVRERHNSCSTAMLKAEIHSLRPPFSACKSDPRHSRDQQSCCGCRAS